MIELAQETQKKAQDEFRAVHGKKRKITGEAWRKGIQETEKQVRCCAARRN